MTYTEVTLIVIIIVLMYLHLTEAGKKYHEQWWKYLESKKEQAPSASEQSAQNTTPSATPTTEAQQVLAATKENIEYFSSCSQTAMPDCSDSDFKYADDEFGAPGMSFKDWAATQSIDNSVIRNHKQFVADRSGGDINKQNITGRTFALDAHESLMQTPWVGIRGRPQMVSQCNPTQTPDVYEGAYTKKPVLTWSSN